MRNDQANTEPWLDATLATLHGYRTMIQKAIDQLDDEQFFRAPAPGFNSVANILRHISGNLQSRFDRFLTEDGEKADRSRDQEFEDWPGDRRSLMEYFEGGWQMLLSIIESLTRDDLQQTVYIRGVAHSVPKAVLRSLTHIAWHVGQIMMICRMVVGDDDLWQWLTIAPGQSEQHNQESWGKRSSESGFADDERGHSDT